MIPSSWSKMKVLAEQIVAETLEDLPPEIQAEARRVPCLLEKRCVDDPEILGIYGHFSAGEISVANGPIILYLKALWEYCEEEDENFEDEVRLTYLHELGHHFGWDEGDLEARGLA